MVGYSIAELKMRQRYRVNLPTIKRPKETNIEVNGSTKDAFTVLEIVEPDTKIRQDDKLVLMGKQHDLHKLLDTN